MKKDTKKEKKEPKAPWYGLKSLVKDLEKRGSELKKVPK